MSMIKCETGCKAVNQNGGNLPHFTLAIDATESDFFKTALYLDVGEIQRIPEKPLGPLHT